MRIHAVLICLLVAGCTTQGSPGKPGQQEDRLPYKKNALIIYSDKGAPIQDALEPLCDKANTGRAIKRSKLGVTLMAGLGFNYAYEEPKASEAVLYMSRKLAEALQEEITRCAVPAVIDIHTSKATDIRTHLSQSLAKRKSDGLIQVSIRPERVGNGSELFISIDYFKLNWESGAQGDTVTTEAGPSRKYQVAPDAPLALYARKFATALYESGYIGY